MECSHSFCGDLSVFDGFRQEIRFEPEIASVRLPQEFTNTLLQGISFLSPPTHESPVGVG
jgi:hypothetical protein